MAEEQTKPKLEVPTPDEQGRAISVMNDYFNDSKRLSKTRRDRMVDLYENLSTFEEPRQREWRTSFKVNKGFTAMTKVASRLLANRFTWLVAGKVDEEGQKIPPEDVSAIQDTLAFIFQNEKIWKRIKKWVKKTVGLGEAWAKPRYQYDLAFNVVQVADDKEDAEQQQKERVLEIVQEEFDREVVDEFPTIDVKSFTDIYYDPRYLFEDELPAIMESVDKVRWSSILRNKNKYFNLKSVDPERFEGVDMANEDKMNIYNIKEVTQAGEIKIDLKAVNLKRYHGVFSPSGKPEDEGLYRLTGLGSGGNVKVLIEMRKIREKPFVKMECFEDIETSFAYGIYEPIKSIEEELNFSKNSKAHYINIGLNRNWMWSVLSGVHPQHLVSSPGNIIVCKDGVPKAKQHLEQLDMPSIGNDAFANEQDLEKQIEQGAFQVSTATPRQDKTLTTATGQRIGFFDNSSVINDIRKNVEAAVTELAYQLLEVLFDNMGDTWVVERIGEERYFRIRKELFESPRKKYNISIETNSSAFDSIETKREDALAFFTFAKDANAIEGVDINMTEVVRDVMNTFEKRDVNKILPPKSTQGLVEEELGKEMPGKQSGATAKQLEKVGKSAQPENAAAAEVKKVAGTPIL